MASSQPIDQTHQSPHELSSKQKKNPIGSWFVKTFGRRNSEVSAQAQSNGNLNLSTNATASYGRRSNKTKELKPRRQTASDNGSNLAAVLAPNPTSSPFHNGNPGDLANTLFVPDGNKAAAPSSAPPPQLAGIPLQEPMGPIDILPTDLSESQGLDHTVIAPVTSTSSQTEASTPQNARRFNTPSPSAHVAADSNVYSGSSSQHVKMTPHIQSLLPDSSDNVSSDTDGSSFDGLGRDSIGNRTMDTGKSRASTKPTTLISLDFRDPAVLPTTHIAQARHGEDPTSNNARTASTTARDSVASSAIHFAPASAPRSGSGSLPGHGLSVEDVGPYVNVPTHSRHHPANNPQPFAVPFDNASVLTLASSSAAFSLGGAASIRGHNHASSLGGARSIGGSLMGDRRNSSDTYASVKALPPLSRRGSDSSSRTRESVATSATGQISAQPIVIGAASLSGGGPGAPSDRISLHRTTSQRTVATQLSIPLSASASNPAIHAYTSPGTATRAEVVSSHSHHDLNTSASPFAVPAVSSVTASELQMFQVQESQQPTEKKQEEREDRLEQEEQKPQQPREQQGKTSVEQDTAAHSDTVTPDLTEVGSNVKTVQQKEILASLKDDQSEPAESEPTAGTTETAAKDIHSIEVVDATVDNKLALAQDGQEASL